MFIGRAFHREGAATEKYGS
uniref:Uncharacterized protein n=1 Tax=Anguilla anguilla TaxID=7936 RepID=A0A0E9U4D1_ANGAN